MKRKLDATTIKNAMPSPNGKPKKYGDGGGLYLLVKWVRAFKRDASDDSLMVSKYWRYKYKFAGKEFPHQLCFD